ncbi:MAG: ATP-binding protein [Halanaerobiaceae bacterium]|nr:ATP-binding protein [Halanaerobiaceae bacterium]
MKSCFSGLERLILYRNLLEDKVLRSVNYLITGREETSIEKNSTFFQICLDLFLEAEENGFQGELLQNYIIKLLALDENPFSLACEKAGLSQVNSALSKAALHDIRILKGVLQFSLADIALYIGEREFGFTEAYTSPTKKAHCPLSENYSLLKQAFAAGDEEEILEVLADYYNTAGCGIFCQYSSFRWDSQTGIKGVNINQPISFNDLIGYERQKEKLIENTEAFLNTGIANNVLLYGDSGTGKSSSIKALVNKFYQRGLRLVEITKDQIRELPLLLDRLSKRGLYFIVFMDDLSFEDFETDYKYLKALMEGGIEGKPANVLFYATTNRKNIIKERWEDRRDLSDVHQYDSQQERLSLSERFGITITFLSPDQEEYLEIVKGLAARNNLYIPEDVLVEEALKWEKWHHGRSGRTAKQFIDYLAGTGA